MQRISISIAGMSCGGCVNSVRDTLAGLPGVHVERVKVGMAAVAYDPWLIRPDAIRAAITKAGYQPLAAERVVDEARRTWPT